MSRFHAPAQNSRESLNHQTHCRQVKFRIQPFTIQGFSERGAGKEGGRDGQRVVARNPGEGLRRASLALVRRRSLQNFVPYGTEFCRASKSELQMDHAWVRSLVVPGDRP